MKTNHQWTRIDTNRPEDRWTCFNDAGPKMRLQFCALARALLNYWVPNSLPGSAGVPPAPSLAQPRPSPPLGSTGNGAMALLRPGRCGSRRAGWLPARHCTKLSGSQRDSMRAGRPRSRARPFPPTGWLPAALHGSSAAAKGTACGRDARAPGQGKNREHGLHLSSMHYSFPSWFFVDNSFFPFPTLGGSLSILLQPLRGYLFLSEARPRYFSPDGTRRMRGERLKEP